MKSILLSTLLLFLSSYHSSGQTCNCSQEFNYIKNKIEKNYAGFRDKVNPKTTASYQKHTQLAFEESKRITSSPECVYLINDWLSFFKDGHIQVGRNRISKEKEAIKIQERMKGIERLSISDKELIALKNTKGITGIYLDKDSSTRIAVVKNKTRFRDYAGVVISSKKGSWSAGQIILSLKSNQDTLKGLLFDKYFIPTTVALPVQRDALGTFIREGTPVAPQEYISENTVESKMLSEKTLYIKISTFNQGNALRIDSLFKANQTNLSKMPNLVLDLRGNGGGADFSYRPILPYLFTNTIKNIGADVLATDDNIAGWAAIATTDGLPADQKTFISEVIKKMEQDKGKLVSFSADRNITADSVISSPGKIIILINKNCGSTTEEFLLLATQSTKVTLMGEHTAGVLDYSNMRAADFSCMPYMLYWATSRSRRIDQGMAIDNVGIKPDLILKPNQDWLIAALHFAEK